MRVVTFAAARRRIWRIATIVFILVLFGVASDVAQAKMPPFEIEVTTDGTKATITAAFDQSYGFDPVDLDGLVAVYPESALDRQLRPIGQSEAVHVSLARVGTGIYQGTIDLDQAGRWAVVPFPTIPEYEPAPNLYPGAMLFETVTSSATIWMAAAGAVAAALLIYAFRTRKGRWLTRPSIAAAIGATVVCASLIPIATTAAAGRAFACPVTIPTEPRFVPMDPRHAERSMEGLVWYGSDDFWTPISTDGSCSPRKSVWWSQNFPGGEIENTPDIEVTWRRLDAPAPPITVAYGTNAYTLEDE
ncbi:MAG TPA: hypothetical protein VM848_14210 [Acidimicrobiia bacterium]|nr:hypothetical protein [Acidimicrobiia bacterium]